MSCLVFLIAAGWVRAGTPVSPNASPEACSLLAFLEDTYGKKTLSGQHEGWRGTNEFGFELTYIRKTTGELPAILSQDFMAYTRADSSSPLGRQPTIAENGIDWYIKHNGIVTFCWHWFAPTAERAFYTKETSFDISRGVTEGTEEYTAVMRDLDTVATELEKLRDAQVPVLWRPMHEMNGRWFWWGAKGPEPFKKLWKLMFTRFTAEHSLTNLLWVFSPGAATDLADWYPGDAYVDLIGQDHYTMDANNGPAADEFVELVNLTGGTRMVGMSENGPIPDPHQMTTENADWLFFITWAGNLLKDQNPAPYLNAVYHHARVMNLSDLPPLRQYPYQSAGPPVGLAFPVRPTDVAVLGTRRRPVMVVVQDADGRTVRSGSFKVSLRLGNNPGEGTLAGTLQVDTIHGVATFPDLTIDKLGKDYTLVASASGLGQAISPAFNVGPGSGILRAWWNTAGETKAGGFPSPAGRELLTKALEYPVTGVTNYAARYRGVLVPPVDGSYVFWLANTGTSQLWLGTDELPSGRRKIGEITAGTPYSKWPHINEAPSESVRLEAGRRYYFEIIHQQPRGSAQLAVRWQLPDGTEERPIPGWRFLPPGPADGFESAQNIQRRP